jgi:hypothetical protein
MFALIKARPAGMPAAAAKPIDRPFNFGKAGFAAMLALSCSLSGCLPATTPRGRADPADPAANVAGAGYRSTIAPYTSLRPVEPGPWLEQNRRVAPVPKSGQQE